MLLERLFTSAVRYHLLQQFLVFGRPEASVRQLAELANSAPAPVSRELRNLESAGILQSKKAGNRLIYSLDEHCPVLPELKAMLRKTGGYQEKLQAELRKLKGIRAAFIFGSYAEGTQTAKSDLDLFILGEPDLNQLNLSISRLEEKVHLPIEYVAMPEKEFAQKKGRGFVKNVLRSKKIFLIGEAV